MLRPTRGTSAYRRTIPTPISAPSESGASFQGFRQSLRLLCSRRFGTFWVATLLSNIGTWAQQVAQPWLLISLGASPFLIGLDSFAINAPVWLLTLIGGALADRANRRRIITVFQLIQMLCPTLIVVLLLRGAIVPAVIIALSLVVGVTDALSMPSFQSITPSIVAKDQIGRGLALNSAQFNLSRILGPAIAGVLMASFGAVACFALSAASYIPFIGVALWILPRGRGSKSKNEALAFERFFADLGQIARASSIRHALLTVLVTSLLVGPIVTFAPVLISGAFHGDAAQFSATVAAFGVGGLLGAVALLALPSGHDRLKQSSLLAAAAGLAAAMIAISPWLWAVPALMAIAGGAMTMSNTSANSLLQTTVRQEMLGRTASFYMLAMRGGLPLGSLLTGLSVEWFGVRDALLINGGLAFAAHLAMGRFWRRSSALETPTQP